MSRTQPIAANVKDVGWCPPPDPAKARRAALTVCRLDPDHATDVLDALVLLELLREQR